METRSVRPWSYSRLGTYTDCPKQFWYKYIENAPPCRPPHPAANRGTEIHNKADKYLSGELKFYPPELQKVAGHAMKLKSKQAKAEQKLAVKEDWSPCDFDDKDAYFRSIIDVLYQEGRVVHLQDWKTGQVYSDHPVQLEQYTALVASHYPEADRYESRLIYIDQGVVTKPKITEVGNIKGIRIMLAGQIQNAEADEVYPVRVGSHCKWCDYSSRYGGPCPH